MMQILVFYIALCVIWSAAFVMKQFDTLRKNFMAPQYPYPVFMLGILLTVVTSPLWIPHTLYTGVVNVIREIRKVEV